MPRGTGSTSRPGVLAFACSISFLVVAFVALEIVRVLPWNAPAVADFAFYHRAASAVLEGRSPFVVPNFNYPALLAFLVAPLAAMDYETARQVWFGISVAAILAAAALTHRSLGGDRAAALAVAATWAAAGGLAVTLREGQVNALLLPLICLALWPPRRSAVPGAAALGAAVALKLWPAILFWGSLFRRDWRRLGVALAWSAVGIAAPLGVVALALEGPRIPPKAGYWSGTPAFLNSGLPAVALRLLDRPAAGERLPKNWLAGNNTNTLDLAPSHAAVALAVFAAGLGVGLWLVRRADRRSAPAAYPAPNGRGEEGELGATLVSLALLIAPIVWPHYQLLQAPGAALLALRLHSDRRFGGLAALALAFVAANWTEAIVLGPYLAAYGRTAGNLPLVWLLSSLQTAGAFGLFVLHLDNLGRPREAHRTGPKTVFAPAAP